MKKRLLSTMLALCLVLTMLPLNALATDEPPVETETGAELQEEEATTPENPTPLTPIEVTEDEQTTTPDSGGTSELGNPSEDATNSQLSGSDSGNEQGETMILSETKESARASVTDSEIMASGTCGALGDNATWALTIYGVLTISGTGEMRDYEIGSYSSGSPSTINDPPWYPLRSRIKSIIIENGIQEIGSDSFQDCENLTKVTIPDSITVIRKSAFKNCKRLNSVTLPNSVKYIEEYVFCDCSSLVNITIPEKVQFILACTFYNCSNLTSVTIKNIETYSIVGSAFYGCNKLTDIYYAGSENDWKTWVEISGYDFLKNVKIHYGSAGTSSGENKPVTPEGNKPLTPKDYKVYRKDSSGNDGYEVFDVSLEGCIKKTDSTQYNPQLAHMLISMCNSVYSENNMKKTFESFGFNTEKDVLRGNGVLLTYSIGEKQLDSGETLMLVVVRGTDNTEEILDNFNASANNKGLHTGFSNAADNLYTRITSFLSTRGRDFSKVKFIITGFSRGAAVANMVSARMTDERISTASNIYAYTFACPDVAVITENTARSYPYIFNINNAKDIVSWVPRMVWGSSGEKDGWGKDSYWDKYGLSYWYSENWDDYNNLKIVFDTDNVHNQARYMDFLRSERSTSEYKTRNSVNSALNTAQNKRANEARRLRANSNIGGRRIFTHVGSHCPVDVEIRTTDGKVVGTIINNVLNEVMPEKIYIEVHGSQKDIFLFDNDKYTISFTGTDEGAMHYFVQNIDVDTLEIVEEKNFANVLITNSKKMVSYINARDDDSGADVLNVQLFVLDNNGIPEKEVLSDGNGTEIPVKNNGDGSSGNSGGGLNDNGFSNKPDVAVNDANTGTAINMGITNSVNANHSQNKKSPNTGE